MQLRSLLQTDDAAAVDGFSGNAALFKFPYPSHYQEIESALANFDFDMALSHL